MRLIYAEELCRTLQERVGSPEGDAGLMEVNRCIIDVPTVDAAPVVRCRNCENWEAGWKPNFSKDGEHFCPMISRVTSGEWFCAYGERRDSE